MRLLLIIPLLFCSAVLSAQLNKTEIEKLDIYPLSVSNRLDTVIDLSAYTYVIDTSKHFTEYIPIHHFNFNPKNRKTVVNWPLVLRIQNTTTDTINASLFFGFQTLISIKYFAKNDTLLIESGFIAYTKNTRRITPNYNIDIKILPNSNYLYQVWVSNYGKMLDPVCSKLYLGNRYCTWMLANMNTGKSYFIIYCLIIGGLIILGLFMLFQYTVIKDRSYFFYALFVFCAALFLERTVEYNYDFRLISQYFPLYFYQSTVPLTVLTALFYINFLNCFITLKQTIWLFNIYKIIRLLLILGLLLFLLIMWISPENDFLLKLTGYCTLFSLFGSLLLGFLTVFKYPKNPLAYFVILGMLALVTGSYISVYLNTHLKSLAYNKYEGMMLPYAYGLMADGLFLSLGLGYKQFLLRKEKEKVLRKNLELEFSSLRSQMNPHFIFNCINNIDSFIYSNDKYNASLYLNKFAKLIRNVLDSSKQNVVSFSKDVETLKLYIELEELRSENKFTTRLNIDEELMNSDFKVPPLIIQPFVENAIIHGLRNKETNDGLLLINISKTENHIVYAIMDNGIGRSASKRINTGKEQSYGLQMSYARIKLFNKETTPSVVMTDLYKNEKATGTKVEVNLKIN